MWFGWVMAKARTNFSNAPGRRWWPWHDRRAD
jgi:hypothetical protein